MRHLTFDVPTPEIHLYPVADVQVGASGVAKKFFREYIEEALEDPLARFIGGGDYTDGISPSNRRTLNVAYETGGLYETPREMLDAASREQVAEFLDLVRGTEGLWDALMKGHHLHEYIVRNADGTKTIRTSDHDIADALGAPYLGEPGQTIGSAMLSYRFPAQKKGQPRPVLRVYTVHGQGGGGTFSGPLNQLEKMMRAFEAHVYLVGHHHKSVAAAATKLHEAAGEETSLTATDARLVSTGSWLRGYMPNEVSYAEDGLLVPLAVGAPYVMVKSLPKREFRIRAVV